MPFIVLVDRLSDAAIVPPRTPLLLLLLEKLCIVEDDDPLRPEKAEEELLIIGGPNADVKGSSAPPKKGLVIDIIGSAVSLLEGAMPKPKPLVSAILRWFAKKGSSAML